MMVIVTVNRRAQRASLLLSIIPCTVVTDSNTGSGDPEQQDQSGEDAGGKQEKSYKAICQIHDNCSILIPTR